jgi:hypothetical protein
VQEKLDNCLFTTTKQSGKQMTKKYTPTGTPLSAHEKEILTILMEECAEVILAASKLIRFGKENRPDGMANVDHLSIEYGETIYIGMMAHKMGLMRTTAMDSGWDGKQAKLERFMQTVWDTK